MFREITLGQYYPVNSILHRLDPRVKLLGVVVYIAAIFLVNNIWGMIVPAMVMTVLIALSKVPVRIMVKGLRMVVILIIFAVFFNLFFSDGDIIWSWWILKLTRQGILRAVFFAIRLVLVIAVASLLTYTTTPTTLTSGLESVFKPLKVIRFPGHEIAMMMSIALRFIPILSEEVNKIINAQLARGADFETGGVFKRAKGMIPILIPLFISAFRRASDLSEAMESRCYHGGNGRTKMNPLKYSGKDIAGYIVLMVYLMAIIAMKVLMNIFLKTGRV